MKIVRAKNNKNKLEIFDNRPFSIDIEFMKKGFRVNFLDLREGKEYTALYYNREMFDEEWELCYNISKDEDISYEENNYYQE